MLILMVVLRSTITQYYYVVQCYKIIITFTQYYSCTELNVLSVEIFSSYVVI